MKKNAMSFYDFREKLSRQLLTYSPQKLLYPGDRHFREHTRSMKKRKRVNSDQEAEPAPNGSLSLGQLEHMEKKRKQKKTRFCGDLSKYQLHMESKENGTTKLSCFVCGDKTRTICGLCDVSLHDNPTHGKTKGMNCFLDFHNETMFGLCKKDSRTPKEWKVATAQDRKEAVTRYRGLSSRTMQTRQTQSINLTPGVTSTVSSLTVPSAIQGASVSGLAASSSEIYEV